MEWLTRLIILLNCLLMIWTASATENKDYILCANSKGKISHIQEDVLEEEISLKENNESFVKCKNSYCYTLWQEDLNNNSSIIMGQGCWDTSGKPSECDRSECLADKEPPKFRNNTKFCCCSANKCNINFTDAYVPPPPVEAVDSPKSTSLFGPDALKYNIYKVVASVVSTIFVSVLLGIAYIYWRLRPRKVLTDTEVESGNGTAPNFPGIASDFSLADLKKLELIGHGRYGLVWRVLYEGQEYAFKEFSAHHRNYYINEREMFKLSGQNAALVTYYGGGEIPPSSPPNTGPQYFLLLSLERESLQEYLKNNVLDLATLSRMSLGVASGLAHLHSDLGKPCIAHRDLNTRNILVKSDLTCCICDLGLAVVPRRAENKSLSEAGTLRYMAPEVLEGAVNLRDCESALKQIDVYALGLVLWEMAVRCSDIQNAEPALYEPPFAREAGENPCLEQMQTLVSRRKVRPLWPVSMKDTAAARLLCETTEDCWDQDAEARLTALCVVERLLELPLLKGRSLHPMLHPPASPTPLINNNHLHDHQNHIDASVGTIETLLSPSEENCKNSNQLAPCVMPLQPYQGRNPCLERNLLSGSSDSLLIDKSSKHCTSSNSESQILITNDFLNFQINHRATPIPYLQNAVHGLPKQQNVNEKPLNKKWNGFKKFFNKKLNSSDYIQHKDTQVKLNTKLINGFSDNVTTSLLSHQNVDKKRPSTLKLPLQNDESSNAKNSGVTQILRNKNNSLSRQRSLEQFQEVFSSTSDLSRLKNPSERIKTPGDVPPSVRKTRGKAATDSARFSLYDDSVMCRGQWGGSAPDLEPVAATTVPPSQPKPLQINDLQDKDSVSSF